MRVFLQALQLHKAGNDPQDYEDYYWPRNSTGSETPLTPSAETILKTDDGSSLSEYEYQTRPESSLILERDEIILAVADGATESSFSALWAKLLVEDFCTNTFSTDIDSLRASVTRASEIWRNFVSKRPMLWYAEAKAKQGAFCTFLAVRLSPLRSSIKKSSRRKADRRRSTEVGEFNGIAVGDCCMFQVRGNKLIARFPLMKPNEFGSTPHLLSTSPTYNESIWSIVATRRGDWKAGDVFLLMTDALAHWFVMEKMRRKKPWNVLSRFSGDGRVENFARWILELRQSNLIRNDDVTLLVVRMLR